MRKLHVPTNTPLQVRGGEPVDEVSRGGRADGVHAGVELGDDEIAGFALMCARGLYCCTQVSRPRRSLWGLGRAALRVLRSAGEAVRDQFAPFSTGPDSGAL